MKDSNKPIYNVCESEAAQAFKEELDEATERNRMNSTEIISAGELMRLLLDELKVIRKEQ